LVKSGCGSSPWRILLQRRRRLPSLATAFQVYLSLGCAFELQYFQIIIKLLASTLQIVFENNFHRVFSEYKGRFLRHLLLPVCVSFHLCVVTPPSHCPRLRFDVLCIDFVRVTNCFYDYDYDYSSAVAGICLQKWGVPSLPIPPFSRAHPVNP